MTLGILDYRFSGDGERFVFSLMIVFWRPTWALVTIRWPSRQEMLTCLFSMWVIHSFWVAIIS